MSMIRNAFWGFFFGTVGLYALVALSTMLSTIEIVVVPLMWPGRFLAFVIAHTDATNLEVATLTLGNGIFYALVFMLVGSGYRRPSSF